MDIAAHTVSKSSQSSPEDGEFWLPPKFLSDDDVNFKSFPTDFPYDLDSSNSPTAESDSSAAESDEDDFFAALSRRFAPKPKPKWAMAGSPQSTLSWSAEGSPHGPSQVTSPPATPFSDNDTWQLIYAAAGQVARLKMASATQIPNPNPQRGLLANPILPNPNPNPIQFGQVKPVVPAQQQWARQRQAGLQFYPNPNQIQSPNRVVRNVNMSGSVCGYEPGLPIARCGGRPLDLPQQVWPPLTRPAPVPTVKRECAGTGVFLPRRYNNPTPEPRKKTAGCPNVVLPAKVVQALNMSFEDMNVNSHPRFGCGFTPDYESLMARRNALLEQQRRSLRAEGSLNHELRLPQDWTY